MVVLTSVQGERAAAQPLAPPTETSRPTLTRPTFDGARRAVSNWHEQGAANLDLTRDAAETLRGGGELDGVARCVKLNNYWCIKKAGWAGEIAADRDGHVAFASAVEGAAVAALLLKRYYVDFNRKTAAAIVSRWAPCGGSPAGAQPVAGGRPITLNAALGGTLGGTLRARWLATHARGFVSPIKRANRRRPRRSTVPDHVGRLMPAPTIALGLGLSQDRSTRPITLDALLAKNPAAPRSRSLIGAVPRSFATPSLTCPGDDRRLAAYAAKAASGIVADADGDLKLFDTAGRPTGNLARMMANMASVEIGPLSVTHGLIETGIADAFKPGRNPS